MMLKLDNTSRRKTLQISLNFMQWRVVSTLTQEKTKHHNREDGSKGTPKLCPYWKLQPVFCTEYGVEIRIWSLNSDNTHSWVRISHESKKFVMNLNNETEVPENS